MNKLWKPSKKHERYFIRCCHCLLGTQQELQAAPVLLACSRDTSASTSKTVSTNRWQQENLPSVDIPVVSRGPKPRCCLLKEEQSPKSSCQLPGRTFPLTPRGQHKHSSILCLLSFSSLKGLFVPQHFPVRSKVDFSWWSSFCTYFFCISPRKLHPKWPWSIVHDTFNKSFSIQLF